jgi:hypothetical protein
MSILKRLITEDLASFFRKRPHPKDADHLDAARSPVGTIASTLQPQVTSKSSLTVVILNWKAGENDPFSVINETIRHHLWACGKNVEVVEISTGDWTKRIADLAASGVEFAYTWQGLGSRATSANGESLWDYLKIPLICVHADHPSHMPLNHRLDSHYCFHLYNNAEFARYSNRHFRRTRSASVIDIPQLHREPRLTERAGDHFVFAKNINDPIETEERWRQQMPRLVYDAHMIAAETLKSLITLVPYVDIHDVLDRLVIEHEWEHLAPNRHLVEHHQYHSQVDHYLRSHKSVAVVNALREFPLRIYGRGWDRLAQNAPSCHSFEAGRNMADSQDLYYTRFGLVDVSPSKRLHDRTRRAMVNGCGFLSSANLEDSFADIAQFDSLFFSFRPAELAERCAAVVSDTDRHHALAQQFAVRYHDTFHFRYFVQQLDQLAKLASAC